MKKVLTTLIILLVVIVTGMTALVVLLNPNDFRRYMVDRVAQKSGYQLTIEGPLRWHVWPQLSILAGNTTLTAPGASAPLVTAENMRIDVQLLPLLSHHLVVKQVLLKRAVFLLTTQSEEGPVEPGSAPIPPSDSAALPVSIQPSWHADIGRLQVQDSLLIWQRGNNDQINVRDINLLVHQNEGKPATLELSSRINRDQRDLTFSLNAELALNDFPHKLTANISQFAYQLNGAGIIAKGIQGSGSMQASYLSNNQRIDLSQVALSVNDSQLSGGFSAFVTDDTDNYVLQLHAGKLDVDALTGWQKSDASHLPAGQAVTSAPVIARDVSDDDGLELFNAFNAQLALKADKLTYHGLVLDNVTLDASNHQGNIAIHSLSGQLGAGDFSLAGSLDTRTPHTRVSLQPRANQLELAPLLTFAGLPGFADGLISMQGVVKGEGLNPHELLANWQAQGKLQLDNAHIKDLNIQQLVQSAISRSDNRVQGMEQYERVTEVKHMQADGELAHGVLQLKDLSARSSVLTLNGNAQVDFPAQQADLTLLVRVNSGWNGDQSLISQLQNSDIPLHIYGPWNGLNYQLQVDQLLRQQAKDALGNWLEKNKATIQPGDKAHGK
jgi:AsmA protein